MFLKKWILQFLQYLLPDECVQPCLMPVSIAVIALISIASYYLCRFAFSRIERFVARKFKSRAGKSGPVAGHNDEFNWTNDILNKGAINAFAQLVPAVILSWLLPKAVSDHAWGVMLLEKLTEVYIICALIYLLSKIMSNVVEGLEKRDKAKEHNLSVIEDAINLIMFIIGAIIALSILFDKQPVVVMTGLGAFAAVLLLIFQDTIKGLVAGVQLTLNGMIKEDDWIVCEKSGINGEVKDIKLTTVKVLNWDNSIATIHPYTLISDSFKNYQNMRDLGARRVARSIYIDFETIRFLSIEELRKLNADGFITDDELRHAGKEVNLSLFRKYLVRYLEGHEHVVHNNPEDSTVFMMVRQLQPTPDGLPLELYFFSNITGWEGYERVQSEVFDHVYAAVREFHLRIFQSPSGHDIHRRALNP